MAETQLLIKCSDASMCIIYKRSIIFATKTRALCKGMLISFIWPDDNLKYCGEIIEISTNEKYLIGIMNDMMGKVVQSKGKQNKKGSGAKKVQKQIGKKPETGTVKAYKNRIDSLANQQIFKELGLQLNPQIHPNPECQPSTSTSSEKMSPHSTPELSLRTFLNKIVKHMDSMQQGIDASFSQLSIVSEKIQILRQEIKDWELSCTMTEEPALRMNSSPVNRIESIDRPTMYCESPQVEKQLYAMDENTAEVNTDRRSYGMPQSNENCNTRDIEHTRPNSEVDRRSFGMTNKEPQVKYEVLSPIRRVSQKLCETITLSEDDDSDVFLPSIDRISPERRKRSLSDSLDSNVDDTEDIKKKIKIEDDRSCTLLYTNMDKEKGIEELLLGSNIFVKGFALKNVKNCMEKPTVLARALMKLVFKPEALSTCSLRGKMARGKGRIHNNDNEDDTRLGLHQGGVDAIIAYTLRHVRKNKLKPIDEQTIAKSMSQKLLEYKDAVNLN